MSYLIGAALQDDNEFEAVRLILIRTGREKARNAAFAAWTLGPIRGQAIISEWLNNHPETLENHAANTNKDTP